MPRLPGHWQERCHLRRCAAESRILKFGSAETSAANVANDPVDDARRLDSDKVPVDQFRKRKHEQADRWREGAAPEMAW